MTECVARCFAFELHQRDEERDRDEFGYEHHECEKPWIRFPVSAKRSLRSNGWAKDEPNDINKRSHLRATPPTKAASKEIDMGSEPPYRDALEAETWNCS